MTESEFLATAETIFQTIQTTLDNAQNDFECTHLDAVLEIETEEGRTIILNRHQPTQELWLAEARGAYHFSFQNGHWRNTRTQTLFAAQLNEVLGEALFDEHAF